MHNNHLILHYFLPIFCSVCLFVLRSVLTSSNVSLFFTRVFISALCSPDRGRIYKSPILLLLWLTATQFSSEPSNQQVNGRRGGTGLSPVKRSPSATVQQKTLYTAGLCALWNHDTRQQSNRKTSRPQYRLPCEVPWQNLRTKLHWMNGVQNHERHCRHLTACRNPSSCQQNHWRPTNKTPRPILKFKFKDFIVHKTLY